MQRLISPPRCALPLYLALFAAVNCAPDCRGAVVERDWLAPGDGLLTLDTVNQREWLDIPVSVLNQFHPSDLDLAVPLALQELQPGGRFEGFQFATRDDVEGLLFSAGIDATLTDRSIDTDVPAMIALRELLGTENELFSTSSGVINELSPESPFPWIYDYVAVFLQVNLFDVGHPGGTRALFYAPGGDGYNTDSTGVLLWREVPEPSGLLTIVSLVCSAAPATGVARRRRLSRV